MTAAETGTLEGQSPEQLVRVPLGNRSYDILIGPGLIGRAGGEITARIKGRRAAIVTDENVGPLYLEALMDSLQTDGIEAVSLTLPAGEKTKCFENLITVVDLALSARLERNDMIIALGRRLGLDIVAEGVETPDQVEWLRRHGCPRAQGYLFAHPEPVEDFIARLRGQG